MFEHLFVLFVKLFSTLYPKAFAIICAFILLPLVALSQTSGVGCNLNGVGLYITYLGDFPYYGNQSDVRPVYLNSTSSNDFIYRNTMGWKSSGNNYNYICGQINEFGVQNNGPAQTEQTSLNKPCEVGSSRTSPSGNNQHGTLFRYTYNNPTYCSTSRPPTNVPLDDHIWLVMLGVTVLGTLYLSKNKLPFGA